MTLTHFNKKNKNTEMVDISNKEKTKRKAIAEGILIVDKTLHNYLQKNKKILLCIGICNTKSTIYLYNLYKYFFISIYNYNNIIITLFINILYSIPDLCI